MLEDTVTDVFNCHVTLALSFNTDPHYLLLLLEQEVDAIGQEVDAIGQEVDAIGQEVDAIGQEVGAIGQE
jgi:hypothetical protein